MSTRQVRVIIEPDGRVMIQVEGAVGNACLDLTRDLEAALGGQLEEREMRSEAYQQEQQDGNLEWLKGE